MSEQELIDFYLANGDLFTQNDIVTGALRSFGFWILKLFATIGDACKQLYDITFGLVDFTTWPKINEFVEAFQPAFVALMAVSLVALGVMLIANHEKKPKLAINICIACLCVTCSTLVFTQINALIKEAKTGIDSVTEESAADVYDIVGNNTMDIYYLDQQIGMSAIDYTKNKNKLPHPKMSKQRMDVMDYTEVLDPDSDRYEFNDDNAEDILTNEIISLGDGVSYKIGEVYDGVAWTSVGNNFYYRYKIDMLPTLLELLALIVLYVAMAYKCTRLAFELAFGRLLAYLYSAELSGGQKVAKIMVFIRDTYILLFITALCIKLFYFFTAYIGELNLSPLIEAAIICFIAFSVIDGPNLVEKLLGMDAGLKSSTARMITAYKMASGAARKATHMATAPARAASRSRERNRQADATSRAIRSAMDQGPVTGAMDMEAEGKAGDKDSGKAGSDGAGNDSAKGRRQEEKDGAGGSAGKASEAAGVSAVEMEDGGERGKEKRSAADQSFDTASFMDRDPGMDMTDAGKEAGASRNDKLQGQYPEDGTMKAAAFMDHSADEGTPIGQMDESAPEDGGQDGQFMSDGQNAESPEASGSGRNRETQDHTVGAASGESGADRERNSEKEKEKTVRQSRSRKQDRFDRMMSEPESKGGRTGSSLDENRVISRYKGKIFDRNVRKDDDR